MTDNTIPTFGSLLARMAAREQILQRLRLESADPELSETDRQVLDAAKGVLIHRNRNDAQRLAKAKD